MQSLRYAGKRYRRAQDDEAAARQKFGDEPIDFLLKETAELLSQHGVEVSAAPQFHHEQDGVDLIYGLTVGNLPRSILLVDANVKKRNIQEIVLDLCGVGYVATGEKQMKPLLGAVATLQQMHAAGRPGRQDKQQVQAREWLEYYLPMLLTELEQHYKQQEIKQDIDLYKQQELIDHFVNVLKMSGEGAFRNRANAQQASKLIPLLDADDYKALIDNMLASRGKAHPLRELINQKVLELTAHEQYSGEVQVLGYDADRVVTAVEIPPPLEAMLFILRFPAGAAQMELVDAGLVLCGGKSLITGSDEELARRMVTAMVELVVASDRTANPEISRPPEEADEDDVAEWSDTELSDAMNTGLVFYETPNGMRYRYEDQGEQKTSCESVTKYRESWQDGTYRRVMNNFVKTDRAFLVDSDYTVWLLNTDTGKPIRKIRRIDPPTGAMQCQV